MQTRQFVYLGLALATLLSAPAAYADNRGEAEAARRHAKAGGPLNDRDAWLLVTYGCATDTPGAYCEGLRKRSKTAYRGARARH